MDLRSLGRHRWYPLGWGRSGVIIAPQIEKISPVVVYQSNAFPTMICTSMDLVNGTPIAGKGSDQTYNQALPFSTMCRQSNSKMKFSYTLFVRMTPVGFPLQTILASLTVHVLLSPLTMVHPSSSYQTMGGVHVGGSERTQVIARVHVIMWT